MGEDAVAMRERLTRENLRGVWAAIATPFDDDDRFDEATFRENLRRLHAAGVHGIYTTDSDGEFYAIELDEFKRIVDVFADETQRLGVPAQVGVTWCNTRGMTDRAAYAARRGILGAHVGHPFFMPMTPESYHAFWQDMRAAVPEWFALIHYNTPRVHNYQYGPDYAVLAREVPNLIGTKHVGSDVTEFLTLQACAPELSHFTGEHALTPYMFLGARGVLLLVRQFQRTLYGGLVRRLRAGALGPGAAPPSSYSCADQGQRVAARFGEPAWHHRQSAFGRLAVSAAPESHAAPVSGDSGSDSAAVSPPDGGAVS